MWTECIVLYGHEIIIEYALFKNQLDKKRKEYNIYLSNNKPGKYQ